MVRLVRCLDALLAAGLVFLVLLLFPTGGRDVIGRPSFVFLLPVLVLAAIPLFIPVDLFDTAVWHRILGRLRLAGLAFAALFPFIIWWFRVPTSFYLLLNAMLAVMAGISFVFHVDLLIGEAASLTGASTLFTAAQTTKYAIFYGMFCILSAVFATILIKAALFSWNAGEVFGIVMAMPLAEGVVLVLLAPVIVLLVLMIALNHHLLQRLNTMTTTPPTSSSV